MESSNAIAQDVKCFFDNLDFATHESDEDFRFEELNSELRDEDTIDEKYEEISQLNEKDQLAVNGLIDKLKKCCLCKYSCIEKVSQNLLQFLWLQERKSMLPRPHRNTGCQPKKTLPIETLTRQNLLLIGWTNDMHNNVFLPSYYSYDRLLATYNLINPNNLIKSCWTFQNIWKSDFKLTLKESNGGIDEDLDIQLMTHITDYQMIRDIYEDDIRTAKICDRSLFRVFSFDFTQDVELPHDSQQPRKWYYPSLLKVYQFGLVDEGINNHWHAIYTKGKASKGANEVASIVHLFLTSATGQAKKFDYGQIIVAVKIRILVFFGHTRNSVNCGFGNSKREYARSEVWCMNQLADIIDKSASNNISVNLENQIGLFHDWTLAFSTLYHKPSAIQNELCSKPQDDVIERIKNLRAARAKEVQN
ncbi:11721_t:CDS:2, partial [Cetraspora pellucida]